jgi:hypothetical protein
MRSFQLWQGCMRRMAMAGLFGRSRLGHGVHGQKNHDATLNSDLPTLPVLKPHLSRYQVPMRR